MFCPNCGTEVGEYHEFCMNCGTRLPISDKPYSRENTDLTGKEFESDLQSSSGMKDASDIQDNPSKSQKEKPSLSNRRITKYFKFVCILLGIIIVISVIWALFGVSAASLTEEGDLLYGEGDFTGALEKYEEALALNNSYVDAWIGKGNVLFQMKDSYSAIESFDIALELEPGCSQAKDGKYNCLMDIANSASLPNCSDYYDQARLLKPNSAEPWLREGEKFEQSGDDMMALECYSSGYSIEPTFSTNNNRLFNLCEKYRPETGIIDTTEMDNDFDSDFNPDLYINSFDYILSKYKTNQITYDNTEGTYDAVIIMTGKTRYGTIYDLYTNRLVVGREYRTSTYVRNGDEFTLYQIPDGLYCTFVTTGNYWNSLRSEFMEDVRYYKLNKEYDYDPEPNYYQTVELTLYPVEGGNVETSSISRSEFQKI